MKRIIVFAGLLVSLSAFATQSFHSWFDLLSENQEMTDWPSDGSNYTNGYKCVVTNTAAATYADSRLSINAAEPMAVVPDDSAPITEVSYAKVRATMKMVPFSESNIPEIPAGAKTAAIAVISGSETNFWVAAGIDELFWTNTCIAADITKDVSVEISVTYGVNCVNTQWILDGSAFTCRIATVAELHGVTFSGQGELSECWGDVEKTGELVNFWLTGIPEEVYVTVTTTNGSVLAKSDIGDYKYIKHGKVNLSFTLPVGWRFCDENGSLEWNDVITITNDQAMAYVPYLGRGIFDTDIGPEDYWMAVPFDGPVERYAELDDALAALKDNRALMSCYSEETRDISVSADGKMITISGVEKKAKPRYHYVDVGGGMAALMIDEGEADITSIGEDASDPTKMSVGSIEHSYSGFRYSVIYGDDVNMTVSPGETEPVEGNGGKLDLAAPKGDAGKRFYRIHITD